MTNFATARKNMIDGQIHTAGVVDEKILEVFSTIPRELFVPEKLKAMAYLDESIDLGQGRCLMAPIALSKMVDAVTPTASDVALVVGAASGYTSAVLSMLVSTVVSLEKNKRHIDKAERVWAKLELCNIVLENANIVDGAPKHAPYGIIFINGAVESVPDVLIDQLAVGGRLITVVCRRGCMTGQAVLFVKSKDGGASSRPLFDVSVPSLAEFSSDSSFQF